MARKIVGKNFLNPMELLINRFTPVISVNRKEWEEIVEFFQKYPAVQGLFDGSVKMETEDPKEATSEKRYLYLKRDKYLSRIKPDMGVPSKVIHGHKTDNILTQLKSDKNGNVEVHVKDIITDEQYAHFLVTEVEACEGPKEVEPVLKPRKEWLENRRFILHVEIKRKAINGDSIPEDWVNNYNECIRLLKDYE